MEKLLQIVDERGSTEGARLSDTSEIKLEGEYCGHLQDVWWDGGTNLWWAHTHQLLRTDTAGKILAQADVLKHNAGLEVRNGKLYVAVCLLQGKTGGKTTGECHPQINVHDALTLDLLETHVLSNLTDRAGSLSVMEDGAFAVGCLRPEYIAKNQVRLHLVGPDFRLIRTAVLDSFEIPLGIETIKYRDGELYLSCYKGGSGLLVAAGSEGNARKGISSVHFLTDGLLSPGDEFVPVCETTTNGLHLVSAGVYKLNSDMKGAVVVGTMRLEGTWPTSGERRQAVMTVRVAGLSLASGIDMFMPYELRAIERDRYDTESHFGLLHNNFSPKPVYVAMMTFITMCPPRSTAVKGKWSERGRIYFSQWRRPSDAKYWMENGDLPAEAGMIWCIGKPEKRLIIFSRSQMRFFDSFGCEIFPVVVDDAYELVLSGEPVYYCGGFVEEVDLQ